MSGSNCCFLTCIQTSQEAGQVVWNSHLFQNFPQFAVIHTVKGFGIVNKAEVYVLFLLLGTRAMLYNMMMKADTVIWHTGKVLRKSSPRVLTARRKCFFFSFYCIHMRQWCLWSRRSPGGGHHNPLQHCVGNPMERGAWRATVHRVTNSRTWLKWFSTHEIVHVSWTYCEDHFTIYVNQTIMQCILKSDCCAH